MNDVRIGIIAIYYEILEVFLANADKLKEGTTISGICFQDDSKRVQFLKRNPNISYAIFNSFELMANDSDEIWIFTYKNKETTYENDYIKSVMDICNGKSLRYKYVDLPTTEGNMSFCNKVTLLFYSDVLNYDFIGLELYYKEKLNQNGLKAQIVNMPSVMNEHYDILNYPIDVKTAAVADNELRNLLNEPSYDVVILNIPYDVSNELNTKRYYNLYSLLSQYVTADYSIMVLNCDEHSYKQLEMLELISKTFFSPVDDYFVSSYGRKTLKSKKDEKEKIMRFNSFDVQLSVDYLKSYFKQTNVMKLKDYENSFENFKNKIDTSVRPYSIII